MPSSIRRHVAWLLLAVLPFTASAEKSKPAPLGSQENVREFMAEMHLRHGFPPADLKRLFGKVHANAAVLKAIRPAAVPELQRSWPRYRERFVNERRIRRGVSFWNENLPDLLRAEAHYGVPREIIVAIIGVETEYGRNMGKFGILEALATLAFNYPPRAPFFRDELEQFLLLARENNTDPIDYKGSYAGAMGIPQFMPSSQRRFATDFDGDSRIDLQGSRSDAIGSVARFLKLHGWQQDQPVALRASVSADPAAWIAAGIKPAAPLRAMTEQGLGVADDRPALGELPAALIDLVAPDQATEYWVGFDNFYVITRYNRSSFYAMAVFQLAEALRDAWQSENSPARNSPN